jgi:hypothetical protein
MTTVLLTACGSNSTSGSGTGTDAGTSSAAAGLASASGSDSDEPTGSASPGACTETAPARPGITGQLPAGFPTVAGWIPTGAVSQGQTKAIRGLVPGGVDDLVSVRDAAVDRLNTAGYRKADSDQEPGYEAEADFTGPQEGNIKVRPCGRNHLLVIYTIHQ